MKNVFGNICGESFQVMCIVHLGYTVLSSKIAFHQAALALLFAFRCLSGTTVVPNLFFCIGDLYMVCKLFNHKYK
jgi:hypothetical protein